MGRELIILGASARAAAFSAQGAGFQPYAIDLFADQDLAALCPTVKIRSYPADFLRALRQAPDAPWIYTGGLENHPDLVDKLARLRPLWGNTGDVLRHIRDPVALADALLREGFQTPQTQRGAPSSPQRGQWLQKPVKSGGGLRIRWYDPRDPPADRDWCYQRFMEGAPSGAVFLALRGESHLLGTTGQYSGDEALPEDPFLYLGSQGPRKLEPAEADSLQRLGQTLVHVYHLRGLFNVDYVLNNLGIWPIEVNPRYSASVEVLERALGKHFFSLHAAEFDSAMPPVKIPRLPRTFKKYCGKAVVYARETSTVTTRLSELAKLWNRPGKPPGLADLPKVGETIQRGQPVATVLVASTRCGEIAAKLALRMKKLDTAWHIQ